MHDRANGRKYIFPPLPAAARQSFGQGSEALLPGRSWVGDHAGNGSADSAVAGSTSAAIADNLFGFIKRTSAQRFDWVSCNCGFWVCEWIKVARGIDPVGHLRSKFEIPEEFKRHVARRGGNEEFSRMIAENAGL